MVSSTSSACIFASGSKEKAGGFFRSVKKFGEQLDFIRLPNKVISTLFRWTEYIPLPSQLLSFFADRYHSIKEVTSTFAIPKFFIKQAKLFEACYHLQSRWSAQGFARLDKIVKDIKNFFFSFLSATIATIKLPQILDKTRIIDLNRISRALPSILAKSECLLSLGLSSMKVIDTTWTLRSQLKRENRSLADWKWNSSPTVTKTLLKLGSNSLTVISNSISAAALFLGRHVNPLVSLVVSTISISAALFSKVACHSKLTGKDSRCADKAYFSLPA